MVSGGRIVAVWPDRLPRWIRGSSIPPFQTIVPQYDLGDTPMDITSPEHLPPTANAAMRAEVFRQIGGFREDLGTLVGGEDTDFMERALNRFGGIRYLPDARVDHPVDRARLSFWWNLKYLHRGGIAQSRFATTPAGTAVHFGVPSWVFKSMFRFAARAGVCVVRGDLRSAAIAAGHVAGLTGFVRGKLTSRPQ
jgi:GT2 family glycosyltransferase